MTDTDAPYEWKKYTEECATQREVKRLNIQARIGLIKKDVSDFYVGKIVIFNDEFTNDDIQIYHKTPKIPDILFKNEFKIKEVANGLFNIDIGIGRFDYRILKLV